MPENDGGSAVDRFYDALTERTRMRTAAQAAGEEREIAPSGEEDVSKIGKVLKDVGVDFGKMQDRLDNLTEKLATAESERDRTAIQGQIDKLTSMMEDRSGGLNSLATDLAKRAIEERYSNRPEDPVTIAIREYQAQEILDRLKGNGHRSPLDSFREQVESYRAFGVLLREMTPAPPPALPASLTPEIARDIEMARLNNNLELGKYRADKEAEVGKEKASALRDMVNVLKDALPTIGEALGNMGSSTAATPGSHRPEGRPAARNNSRGGRAEVEDTKRQEACPSCKAPDSLMLTESMLDNLRAGGAVQATCTECGVVATMRVATQAKQPAAPPHAEPPPWGDWPSDQGVRPGGQFDDMYARSH